MTILCLTIYFFFVTSSVFISTGAWSLLYYVFSCFNCILFLKQEETALQKKSFVKITDDPYPVRSIYLKNNNHNNDNKNNSN